MTRIQNPRGKILDFFDLNPDGLFVDQIATHMGMNRNTVNSYLTYLKRVGILRNESTTEKRDSKNAVKLWFKQEEEKGLTNFDVMRMPFIPSQQSI